MMRFRGLIRPQGVWPNNGLIHWWNHKQFLEACGTGEIRVVAVDYWRCLWGTDLGSGPPWLTRGEQCLYARPFYPSCLCLSLSLGLSNKTRQPWTENSEILSQSILPKAFYFVTAKEAWGTHSLQPHSLPGPFLRSTCLFKLLMRQGKLLTLPQCICFLFLFY